jgi:hypothetical protein
MKKTQPYIGNITDNIYSYQNKINDDNNKNIFNQIILFINSGNIGEINNFLNKPNFNINYKDPNTGDSYLHIIINTDNKIIDENQKLYLIELFVCKNININLKNKLNETPLLLSINYSYYDIIKYFLKKKKIEHIDDINNNTYYHNILINDKPIIK